VTTVPALTSTPDGPPTRGPGWPRLTALCERRTS
jgi:hypothetical protein